MSGSDRPTYTGGGSSEPPDCASLVFSAILASPQEAVVEDLSPGEELEVVLDDKGPTILAMTSDGRPAGSIVARLVDLLRCLQDGYEFMAVVDRLDGGQVNVTVSPR